MSARRFLWVLAGLTAAPVFIGHFAAVVSAAYRGETTAYGQIALVATGLAIVAEAIAWGRSRTLKAKREAAIMSVMRGEVDRCDLAGGGDAERRGDTVTIRPRDAA